MQGMFRFSLRTLTVVMALAPPAMAGLWLGRNLTWRDVPAGVVEALGIILVFGGALFLTTLVWFSAVLVGWRLRL
jgi:hypothetical protein